VSSISRDLILSFYAWSLFNFTYLLLESTVVRAYNHSGDAIAWIPMAKKLLTETGEWGQANYVPTSPVSDVGGNGTYFLACAPAYRQLDLHNTYSYERELVPPPSSSLGATQCRAVGQIVLFRRNALVTGLVCEPREYTKS